jgi:hypothetical protein
MRDPVPEFRQYRGFVTGSLSSAGLELRHEREAVVAEHEAWDADGGGEWRSLTRASVAMSPKWGPNAIQTRAI